MFDARTGSTLLVTLLLATAGVAGAAGAQSSDQVTLTVTVVDGDGEPLGNVDLTATWEADGGGSVSETTRSNGQVLIDVPRGANVTITVEDDRYVRNEPFVVEDADAEGVTVPVSEDGRATVAVVDTEGPVDSAIVQLFHGRTTVVNVRANASGQYTTPRIEQGTYTLTVFKQGYLRNRSRLTVDGNVSERVRITQASRLVAFSVTDDHFAEPRPVADATIAVGGNTITTLSDGEATIQLPVNRNYEVEVTKEGYDTVTRSLHVGEDQVRRNISIQRVETLSIDPEQSQVVVGQSVRVTVTDEYGDPVPNATVSVGGQTVGRTDADGRAVVPVDTAGETEIRAATENLSATVTVEGVDPDEETPTPTATATPTATPTPTETPGGGGAPADTTTTRPSDGVGPGFTGVGALIAVALALALLTRRS